MHSYYKMGDSGLGTISNGLRGRRFPVRLILSYLFDWLLCFVFVGIGGWLDKVAPAKRPFSLVDPNISYVPSRQIPTTTMTIVIVQLQCSLLATCHAWFSAES